ncbi:helix-turn-helix domain-containing protein [Enterococcus sp. AZ109]|uniref:helix-turn-helix domain-containing protein n=1 Tax=Enterococcus sp. AZ109 TaxID=2774634 RepID=UPI003F20A38B
MVVFERIKLLSQKRDLTLQQVAEELGFSKNIFYKWKTSEPKGADLQKVADFFNVSVDYLLGRTDNPTGSLDGIKKDLTVEEALDSVMSYDGEPLTDNDKEILKAIIEAYLEKKKG